MASGLTLQPGQLLGRYRLLRHIGLGGMGTVFEAEHASLGKRCAVKILKPEVSEDPAIAARLQREGVTASRLRHRNVVDVYDIDSVDGTLFLVMEYLEGEDFSAYLDREGPLPAERALDLLLPVLDAVEAAHRSGIIHRDLKPSNIFLERDSHGVVQPKVLDFGLARPFERNEEPSLTLTGSLLGTPRYMSPEQVSGKKELGPATDQYSLGVLLYETLIGASPFTDYGVYGVILQIANGEIIPPLTAKPDLSDNLAAIILKAMAVRPEDRFKNLHDMAKALLPFAPPATQAWWGTALDRTSVIGPGTYPGDLSVAPSAPLVDASVRHADPVTDGSIAPPRTSRYRWALPVGGLAVLLGLGGVSVYVLRPNAEEPKETPPSEPIPLVKRFRISVEPPTASIIFDRQEPVVGELRASFRPGAEMHRVVIMQEGYITQIITFRDNPPTERIVLEPIGER